MEGLRRLSQLYSDTKRASDLVAKDANVAPRIPELIDLHLAFRIQRERLAAWGFEWSDDNAAAEDLSIDEEVARAGLTSTVTDVLHNIHRVLEEAEQIRCSGYGSDTTVNAAEKLRSPQRSDNFLRWTREDKARYAELATELETAINLLYDLSKTRRELRQGTYPSSGKAAKVDRPITPTGPPPTKTLFLRSNYSESEETLVNPSRASTSKTYTSLELPSRLDPNLLELPDEKPPPYDSIGATQSSRMIAYLKQPQFPSAASGDEETLVKIPVLVEFAPFDPAYRASEVAPPSQRLDALLAYYARTSVPFDGIPTGSLSCLGFFEDPKVARYGLVYELPKSSVATINSHELEQSVAPQSLLNLLQASSRALNRDAKMLPIGPPLEDRYRMAFNLVHAFSRMHIEENLTHKAVNSGNVIFFPKSTNSETAKEIQYETRTPFITSFDLFTEHNLEQVTLPTSRNIYRNPDDPQVTGDSKAPEGSCSVCKPQSCKCGAYRFDIYSLALVLIEVGYWMNLADIFKQKYSLEDFKYRIDTIWVKRLGNKCGTVYMKVVEDMLSKASSDIAEDALRDLYNQWLSKLQRCCLIDDAEDQFPILYLSNRAITPPNLTQSRTQSWSPKQGSRPLSRVGQATALPFAITEAREEEAGSMESSATQTSRVMVKETDPTVRYIYERAARTIQQAWRRRSSTSKTPFREYKRKVSLIQQQWRNRRYGLSSQSGTSSENIEHISQDDVRLEAQLIRATEHSIVHIERDAATAPRAKLRIQNVKMQPDVLDLWGDMQPQLERIVERTLRNSPESASIDLFMVGETELTAKPTILVTCTSTSRVRGALARKFSFDPELFDLKVRRGKVRRSKATRTRGSPPPHRSMLNNDSSTRMPLNPYHQKRPLCGASIGAYMGKHLPPVSFGGIIDVDGEFFGMTVHHLLDDPSDDEYDSDGVFDDEVISPQAGAGAHRSSGRRVNVDDMVRGLGGNPTLQSFPTDSMFPLEISDDDEDSFSGDEHFSSDAGYESEDQEDEKEAEEMDNRGTQGDIRGLVAGDECDILVTQPALDDVDEHFFPNEEDRDDDHISSHSLGYVYASSGIKRWNRKGVLHEIDWAVLKLNDDRVQPCNLIQGGRKYVRTDAESKKAMMSRLLEPVCRGSVYTPEDDEFPTEIARSDDLRNLPVHCFGRTSGLQGGVIGPAMSSVRIYKRRSFSRSWYVMGDFGVGGDSGAWVIDNDEGRVCGHVLAWCERNSIAYICPADVLLEDMKRTLGATRICLPGSQEESVATSNKRMIGADAEAVPAQGAFRSQGLPDISRLGLGQDDLMHSVFDGSAVSPRMEMRRLFGGGIAR